MADEIAFLDGSWKSSARLRFNPKVLEIVQVSTTVKRKQTTAEEKEVPAHKPATLLDVYVQGTRTDMAVDSDDWDLDHTEWNTYKFALRRVHRPDDTKLKIDEEGLG